MNGVTRDSEQTSPIEPGTQDDSNELNLMPFK